MPKTKERKPDGKLGYFLIHGKANLVFLTPWKSKGWMELKQAEESGEIAAMFPRTPVARAATGATKEMIREMSNRFNADGLFKTRDPEVAAAAFKASMGFDKHTKVNEHSLPLPEAPEPEVISFDDLDDFEFEGKVRPDFSEKITDDEDE